MSKEIEKYYWNTIVIGAGQSGLATGYFLSNYMDDFIILDQGVRVGDSWRKRWDSLKLFTPSQYDGLPGLPFPAPKGTYPNKDEMAGYLEGYAEHFALPIKLNVQVSGISRTADGFEISSSAGKLKANHIVIATGTNPIPRIPEFAEELNKNISQIHSSQYHNPDSLPVGDTLVVGAGTSGVEIALELAESRRTLIAGHPTPHIPDPIFRYAGGLYWWFISNILTVHTPIGRKARQSILKGGAPLIRISMDQLAAAGVERLPRVAGVKDGQPLMEDGRVISVSSVVWSTGFKPDFSWINIDLFHERGWPKTKRGVSEICEGLYFMGMLFQFGLTSGLVGGVGRDAAFVANHIHHKH